MAVPRDSYLPRLFLRHRCSAVADGRAFEPRPSQLEVATNIWGSDVSALLAAVRAAAPNAAVAIVGWASGQLSRHKDMTWQHTKEGTAHASNAHAAVHGRGASSRARARHAWSLRLPPELTAAALAHAHDVIPVHHVVEALASDALASAVGAEKGETDAGGGSTPGGTRGNASKAEAWIGASRLGASSNSPDSHARPGSAARRGRLAYA